MLEKIKDFVAKVGDKVLGWTGLNLDALWLGVIVFGVALVIVLAVIIGIVCGVKKKKKAKKALEQAKVSANSEKAKQNNLVQQASAEKKEEVAPIAPIAPIAPAPVAPVAPVAPAPVVEQKAEEPVPAPVAPVATVEEVSVQPVVQEPVAPVAPAPVVEEKTEEPAPVIETPAPVVAPVAPAPVVEEKKAPAKKPTAKKAPVAKKPLPGKWVVELKSVGEFMSKLLASNGEVMLSSEIYSSEEGARSGIATIIKWVEEGSFVIYQDKKKNYYYKLKTSGNRLICVGEIYKSEEQCLKAVESVKRIAKTAIVNPELIEGARYIDYKPLPFDENAKGPKGKWKVEAISDGKFCAKLYASNGQLMIATEEVSQRKTALNAIESVKKNSIEGNFIVDRDKFGRYYYKLRNAQKSVICIGEAYDSLDACTKALESVRRFAVNAIVIPE